MKRISRQGQSGYALILLVLALMGVGGVVIAGYTQGAKQQTEHQQYLHNERVLREAKQALLQYAYNYPVTNGLGPGRLPNADTDNDGIPNGGATFGRLPWDQPNLNLYDIRDAAGQRLWYAVSSSFRPQEPVINSDTSGTITLRDQSGNVIFDGSNPAGLTRYGVAAVIIAPGPPIDRNGVKQDRAADPNAAANYLDLVAGTEDNAGFTHSSATDGLILGPINDLTNDQFIVITAAEVTAMAEQATLQTYRMAINDYLAKTGGVYPWLYNYEGIDYIVGSETVDVAIAKLSTFFPAEEVFSSFWLPDEKDTYIGIDTSGPNDGIFGRIPTIFANYFTEADSLKIESRLAGTLDIDFSGLAVGSSADGGQQFLDGVVSIPFTTTVLATNVGFEDIADSVGKDGRFTATMPSPQTFSKTVYFWDDDDNPTDVWRICGNDADDVSDCWRDSAGNSPNPTPHGSNDNKEYILEVVIQFKLEGTLNIDADYAGNPPTIASISPAEADAHATIESTYSVGDLLASSNLQSMITATYVFDHHYHADGGSPEVFQADPVTSFGNLTTADLSAGTSLTIGMRYFPELPVWALDNGWHNSIRMAYALEYEPPFTGPCIVDTTCLKLDDSPGTPQNVVSLLMIGGTHDWVDGDPTATLPVAPNGNLKDELKDVFDDGNHNNNQTFYRHRGNDKLLVIEEL